MAKQSIAKRIAAAQETGRTAAQLWVPSFNSLSDHRLRFLMNFERDVVKSTWDDADAMLQWKAFLDAFDAESKDAKPAETAGDANDARPPSDAENAGLSYANVSRNVIRMDEARSKRFSLALHQACDAAQSLRTTATMFPSMGASEGEMDAAMTVAAFTLLLDELHGLMLAMVNGEEHLNEEHREARDA